MSRWSPHSACAGSRASRCSPTRTRPRQRNEFSTPRHRSRAALPFGWRPQMLAPVPRTVPALLSFAAGFVDACTFLALFGLYVAQVTGSFVVAGAEIVTHDEG